MQQSKSWAKLLTIHYAAMQSTFWMGFMCIRGFTAVYLTDRGFSSTLVGIVVALSAGLSILLQSVLGSLADRKKNLPLRFLTAGMIFSGLVLATVLMVFPLNVIPLIFLIYVVMNTILTALQPFITSLAYEYINHGVDVNFGLARGIGSVTCAVISSLMGKAILQWGSGSIFPCLIFMHILLLILTLTFVEAPKHLHSHKPIRISPSHHAFSEEASSSQASTIWEFFRRNKSFTWFIVAECLTMTAYQTINTYQINIATLAGGNSSTVGNSLAIAATCELPAMMFFTLLLKKFGCNKLLRVSSIFFFLKVFGMFCARSVPMIYIAASMQFGGFALFLPASTHYANENVTPEDRVKGQALLSAATVGLATMLGSFVGGVLVDSLGVKAMLFFCTVIVVLGGVMVWCLTGEKKKSIISR